MNGTVTIPCASLYWAVLELSQGEERLGAVALASALEDRFWESVPVANEPLKAAFVRLDDRRALGVAAERRLLASVVGPETVVVRPEGVPEWLATDTGAAASIGQINFLWGDLEPRPVVAARRRVTALSLLVIVVLTGLGLAGVQRRINALLAADARQRAETERRLLAMYPKAGTAETAGMLLERDVSRLSRTRLGVEVDRAGGAPGGRGVGAGGDAADALAAVLTAWPRSGETGNRMRTDSLSATAQGVVASVTLEDRAGTILLSDRLRSAKGWRLLQPQFTASSGAGGVVNLRLVPETGAGEGLP